MNSDQQIVLHTRGKQVFEKPVTAIVPDMESATIKVVWEFWRMNGRQSDYHRREIGVIDLGEI